MEQVTNQTKEIFSYRKLFEYKGHTLYIYWDVDYCLTFGIKENKWMYQELYTDCIEEDFELEMDEFEGMYDNKEWDKFLPIVDKILNDEKNKIYLDKVKNIVI